MSTQITLKAAVIGCLIVLLIGIALGAWGKYTWGPKLTNTVEKTIEKPVIVEKVVTQTETQIAYVPKETIKYVDPQTGQEVTQPLDGQFEIGKTDFHYTVNGKPGQFTKADDERYVFDKNMLKLTQTSQVNLAVEVPVIDKTKRNAFGPYLTTESWGAIVSRETDSHRLLLLGGKKWDKENGRSYEAGGAWQIKF
ncbi:MAG TPA: hypothetical protein PKA10_19775 [Selenomonadales bacterium]|nr:hypothetical protein [Selenomonadales bacterium]